MEYNKGLNSSAGLHSPHLPSNIMETRRTFRGANRRCWFMATHPRCQYFCHEAGLLCLQSIINTYHAIFRYSIHTKQYCIDIHPSNISIEWLVHVGSITGFYTCYIGSKPGAVASSLDVSKCLRKNWSKFAWLLQDVLCVYVCIHAHFMESRGRGLGGVLSLSFKLLIRLGHDKPLLRPY